MNLSAGRHRYCRESIDDLPDKVYYGPWRRLLSYHSGSLLRIAGFLDNGSKQVTFMAELVNARTGDAFGTISIPFVVK